MLGAKIRETIGLLALLSAALLPVGVSAAESPSIQSSRTVATLVTDTDSVAAGRSFHAALRLRLAPGWHTYWQNPGDAGIPSSVDLALPPGSSAGPIEWPLPQRVAEGTLTTYAYTGDVVLPFEITPGQGGQSIKAHAEWLACKDVCVPESADLALLLPEGIPSPSPQAALIQAARAHVPHPAPFAATLAADGTLTLSGNGLPRDVTAGQFFPNESGVVERAGPQAPLSDAGELTLRLDPISASPNPSTGAGVLALSSRDGTVAYELSPTLVLAAKPQASPHLIPLLLLALGGGLLLNLMPCVFPILAMKAIALTRLAGAPARRIRAEAASYSLGVVATFMALGGALAALREAGQGAGWGFQFQSPVFVTVVAWVLFAVGLSLSGVFAVGTSLMGRGRSLTERGGHLGSFLTGVLAVVVASPCTAPFMGTAVAGALTLPARQSLAVFAALGAGLALPYAVLASVPRLAAILPRPGQWMVTLQQMLAFPMYAATAWLVWVVSQQTGPAGVLTASVGLVGVGLATWSLGQASQRSGWSKWLARCSASVVGVLLIGLLSTGVTPASDKAEPFTTARFDELRNQGRPIFVNMTAAWCLSCLVNEKLALSPPAVQAALAQSNVAYLKGDWTTKNPAISTFLHQLGSDGVPLYVIYAPGRNPVVLPEILTEATVLDELAKLKG